MTSLTISTPAQTSNNPSISSQPTNLTVNVGSNATFSVGATGTPPLFYQWQFNATNLNGATNSTLTITNTTVSSSGSPIRVEGQASELATRVA